MRMLKDIKSPRALRSMSYGELQELAGEIRREIISTVSVNGGHLASNLGFVEATLALHRIFNAPDDTIIFDVGHQCYAHKLLTGREGRFSTLRQYGGISGFPNREESQYDAFSTGHSGNSVSAALGIACAKKLRGDRSYTVAVVGDGSMTNGMIYEALNNCGSADVRLIILINDNEMSISRNVGGVPDHLAKLKNSRRYFILKHNTERVLAKIPLVGRGLVKMTKGMKDAVKRVLIKDNFFGGFGVDYIGPVDGNNLHELEIVLDEAKYRQNCCIVHIKTRKGMGYTPAEAHPDLYHAVAGFDQVSGEVKQAGKFFSTAFGETLNALAVNDARICAVSAAMCDGTGLSNFRRLFPGRFFDVGIAEEHAVTFSAGLSDHGMRPVLALYATFAQRVYDQLAEDAALQRLPLVIALDRCGIVPSDGVTHQGIFAAALFSSIPGITMWSPVTFAELDRDIRHSLDAGNVQLICYYKGSEIPIGGTCISATDNLEIYDSFGLCEPDAVIITYGRISAAAVDAAESLSPSHVRVIRLKRIFPLDREELLEAIGGAHLVYFAEEGVLDGGIAQKTAAMLVNDDVRVILHTLPTEFLPCGAVDELLEKYGLDTRTIAAEVSHELDASGAKSDGENKNIADAF